ncbi:reverse transcriptase domain-containing protein [Tanacetum coccineum]|uniref:Reverse transcriptase domain-containing protein n=1 Tax=Tanacetum coccineum TaxID=301880 RepID=A0ABQ5AVJ0_9ASTR
MNTAVAHPQANGLIERENKSLMEGIKTRLGRERAGWVDELPNVLCAHRTSIKQSNGETPFSLTYGSEAVISAKIDMPTYRTMMIREGFNEEEMRLNLDLLQERRELAAIREAGYKTKLEQYYNKRVHLTSFKSGEFVFRKNKASRVEDQGKLGPKWEGPYRVMEAYQNGSYKLQTMDDKEVPRTWHAINLRNPYSYLLGRDNFPQLNMRHSLTPDGSLPPDEHMIIITPKGYVPKGKARVHITERHHEYPKRLRAKREGRGAQHRKAS